MDMAVSSKTHSGLTVSVHDHNSTYNNRQFDGITSTSRYIYITFREKTTTMEDKIIDSFSHIILDL